MTGAEIKKAFEQFKKELNKETGIHGRFAMNAKQINNRTATYLICNLIPYEEEIKYHMDSIDRVRNYTNWTDEHKARWIEDATKWAKMWEGELAKYGTKEAYAGTMVDRVVNSKAFARFSDTLGGVTYHTEPRRESGLDVMYLRFNY